MLALRVTEKFFSPSLLLCLKDIILPYHLLKYCLNSYRQDYEKEDDPFINPIFADDILLKFLPPIRIISGSSDPLRDDSVRFLKRLM